MNRKDLQGLANLRLREARTLLRAEKFSGAYYLVGYAVECALKACIAKAYRKHDFPEKKAVVDAHTHNLKKLVTLANLEHSQLSLAQADPLFARNWELTIRWSEETRYRVTDERTCRELVNAIMEKDHGIMPWLKKYW